ncbi:Phage-related replication protein YjqB, UPF0714/DUF867 family [Thermoactinomyces sp. DSM 45891]|uniref:poly-gamma-glutamate hydrolase family protein n=1 Tax=Thermoactinomyces sp. DSM 45891 TaxID=1761907 RepID=UPI00091187F3|nr:poly-gamma-glutamate hydrolase family protein [Thermoactinomyces sp. DSM 45891]SFX65266.1 Phage-related replication protein YjqB, UPF0714/DUF867 family [Thermoactinomyces sp. DSM 45891]
MNKILKTAILSITLFSLVLPTAKAKGDYYPSMTALYADNKEGVHYTREWKQQEAKYSTGSSLVADSNIFVAALHGGSIEMGTTELALATSGEIDGFNADKGTLSNQTKHDFFNFNGMNPPGQNGNLHVTASNYDDKDALRLVEQNKVGVAFHGCTDAQPTGGYNGYKAILIGGLDTDLKILMEKRLKQAGFNAYITNQELYDGDMPQNLINKTSRKAGLQFEMTTSMRASLFGTNTREKRRTTTNSDFWHLTNTIREALLEYEKGLN